MVNWDRYSGEVGWRFHFLSVSSPIKPLVRWNCVAFSLRFTQPWAVSRWDRWDRRAPSSDSCPPIPSQPIPSCSSHFFLWQSVVYYNRCRRRAVPPFPQIRSRLPHNQIGRGSDFLRTVHLLLSSWVTKITQNMTRRKKATYNSMTNYVSLILNCTKTILTR